MTLRSFVLIAIVTACSCAPSNDRVREKVVPQKVGADQSDATPDVKTNGELRAIDASDGAEADSKPALSKPRRVEYKPGVTLDYETLQVEIASRVILRQGELELFAWSRAPVPKEHETILMVDAKPSDIFAALGLIGLVPGTPPRFDFETKTAYVATGDRVDVFVRYKAGGRDLEHSICDWAIDKSRNATMARRSWTFCGSHRTENGAFAADIEGTLVTVVDFPTSLLALAESHSESNADLWLVANTAAIPDVGTPVTLILRPAEVPAVADRRAIPTNTDR